MLQSCCCYCCCYPQKTISSFEMRDGVIPACVPTPPVVAAHSCQFHSTHVSHPRPKMQRLLRARDHRGRCRLGMRRRRLSPNGEKTIFPSSCSRLRASRRSFGALLGFNMMSIPSPMVRSISPNRVLLLVALELLVRIVVLASCTAVPY